MSANVSHTQEVRQESTLGGDAGRQGRKKERRQGEWAPQGAWQVVCLLGNFPPEVK